MKTFLILVIALVSQTGFANAKVITYDACLSNYPASYFAGSCVQTSAEALSLHKKMAKNYAQSIQEEVGVSVTWEMLINSQDLLSTLQYKETY